MTAKSLIYAYLNKDEDDKRTILSLYDEHNKKLKILIGKSVAPNTYKSHETSRKHLCRFLQEVYKMKDFYLNDIIPSFIDRYEEYFRVDRECNNNTPLNL